LVIFICGKKKKYSANFIDYMWFTGINYYKLAVEKDRDSIFTRHFPW
jgi:hypothetical protein